MNILRNSLYITLDATWIRPYEKGDASRTFFPNPISLPVTLLDIPRQFSGIIGPRSC